ncbi:hypothetical protein [uncultured Maribacter sp.]|tara:strand:- start:186 stop:335 length:150 start_codon:yes stop_codon:yes gene_type:complete
MENRKATNTETESLQKLREEIEKGWKSGISNRSIKDIIATKQYPRNKDK